MYFVYVLKSIAFLTRYVGSAEDLEKRVNKHNQGRCRYTAGRRPWKLVHYECFETRAEAYKRELFLKSGQGRKYLDDLLKNKEYVQ